MNVADLCEVVNLHVGAFPGHYLTRLGSGFLSFYYGLILDHPTGIVLVAREREAGTIVGFVAGVVNPPAFYAALATHRMRISKLVIPRVFRSPAGMARLFINWRRVRNSAAAEGQERTAELTSIAVRGDLQGRGVGAALVDAFNARAAGGGANLVSLITDAENNDYAIRFYENLGFITSDYVRNLDGRRMFHFTRVLRPADASGGGPGS